MNRWSPLLAGFFSLAVISTLIGQEAESSPRFESHILPILETNCLSCHDHNVKQAGLLLTNHDDLLKGAGSRLM